MQSLRAVLQKNPSFVSRKIVDEVILVPVSHKVGEIDCLYALNEVGARIWDLIDGDRSLKELRDAIIAEFEVSETEAEQDCAALLEERGLGNLSGGRSEELVHIGNYIYPAIVEGVVKEFFWVVPDSFVENPTEWRHVIRQFQNLQRINPRAMKGVSIDGNRVVAE